MSSPWRPLTLGMLMLNFRVTQPCELTLSKKKKKSIYRIKKKKTNNKKENKMKRKVYFTPFLWLRFLKVIYQLLVCFPTFPYIVQVHTQTCIYVTDGSIFI